MNGSRLNAAKKRIGLALWMVFAFCAFGPGGSAQDTALDRYVAKPDRSYAWKLVNTITGKGYKSYVDTIGHAYSSELLKEEKPGIYIGRAQKPVQGYTAFFVELLYDSGGKYPFKFTTEVSVVPDVLPFSFNDARK